jgi:uncharacterized protein YndB with AHSA1/START domain
VHADADSIIKEIFIEAPPDVVFQFLTDPEKMICWMGIKAEIDPKPGGVYRLDSNGRDVIRGTYLEVVPSSRVVFTWGWDEPGHSIPAGSTRVEIDLKAERGGTLIRLVHQSLPPKAREGHTFGWGHYLERLKTVSEGSLPGPDALADPSIRHGQF